MTALPTIHQGALSLRVAPLTCVLMVRRLSHSEAALMDPQARILLEQTSLALTDANCGGGTPVGSNTGVYVGVMHMEYIQHLTGTPGSFVIPILLGLCVTKRLNCCSGHLRIYPSHLMQDSVVKVTPHVSTGNGMDFLVGPHVLHVRLAGKASPVYIIES